MINQINFPQDTRLRAIQPVNHNGMKEMIMNQDKEIDEVNLI